MGNIPNPTSFARPRSEGTDKIDGEEQPGHDKSLEMKKQLWDVNALVLMGSCLRFGKN